MKDFHESKNEGGPDISRADPHGNSGWWETPEEHRFALEVLQLPLRRRILKFLGSGARAKQEVEAEFGLQPEQADYHLALLEKALVIEKADGSYRATKTGVLYLERVEARR